MTRPAREIETRTIGRREATVHQDRIVGYCTVVEDMHPVQSRFVKVQRRMCACPFCPFTASSVYYRRGETLLAGGKLRRLGSSHKRKSFKKYPSVLHVHGPISSVSLCTAIRC